MSQPLPALAFSSVKWGYSEPSLGGWLHGLKKTVHGKSSAWYVGSVSCCYCWNYDYFYYCYNTRRRTYTLPKAPFGSGLPGLSRQLSAGEASLAGSREDERAGKWGVHSPVRRRVLIA